MKFVVCIFTGINLVVSLQQNEPIKWICALVSFLFDIFRLMRRRLCLHHHRCWCALLVSPTPRACVFYLHMRKFIVFLCDIQIVSSYKLTTLESNLFSAILSTRLWIYMRRVAGFAATTTAATATAAAGCASEKDGRILRKWARDTVEEPTELVPTNKQINKKLG